MDSPADIQVMTEKEARGKLGYDDLSYNKQKETLLRADSVSPSTSSTNSRHDDRLSRLYPKPISSVQPSKSRPATKSVKKAKKSDANVSSAQQHGSTSSKSAQTSVQKKLDHLYSQGNISPTQSSKPKTIQSKPPPQKTSKPFIDIPPWIWWAVAIVLISLFFSSITSKTPQIQATSTPRPQATATLRQKPTLSAFQVAATESDECLKWTQVKSIPEGKQECVYGIVIDKRRITTDNDSWFLIRFDANPATFYIISEKTLQVKIGNCVVSKSIVNYDLNGIPYMKVTEISIENDRCS